MLDWLAVAGAEEKPRLAVTDELNQQLRHVLREVDVTFPIFRVAGELLFRQPSPTENAVRRECL